MSDEQEQKTESTAAQEGKTSETYEDINIFSNYDEDYDVAVGRDTIKGEPYNIPVDDTGKTTEQILAEEGVSMEKINKTFPPDYQPITGKLSEMTTEELLERMKASQERQKNKKAYSNEKADMPSPDQINRMNSERANGKIGFGSEGPSFEFEGFLKLLEKSKEDARRKQETELEQKIRQMVYGDMKKPLEEIVETSELETFNAQAAKRMFLEKAKEQSHLQGILKTIRSYAKKGRSELRLHYICQYDWTRLSELGFAITNLSNVGNLEYKISWYSREQT